MPLMGIREYARYRGVTHPAVINAIKTGRISKNADGKIDSDQADKDWARETDQSKPLNSVSGNPKHKRVDDGPPVPVDAGQRNSGFMAARTVRETYQAKKAKLDYEISLGKMVNADDVRVAAFKAGRVARDKLMSLPSRIAAEVAAMDTESECRDALDKEVREVCASIEIALAPGDANDS